MRMALTILVVLLLAGAFVGGYWPQHQQLVTARAEADAWLKELEQTRSRLAAAEVRVRLAGVLGQLLALDDAVAAANFAEAQKLSSGFFDAVRAEVTATSDAAVRTALEAIQAQRDGVTADLARANPAVRERLRTLQLVLRAALGYPRAPARAAEQGV